MTHGRFLLRTSIMVIAVYGANKVTGFVKLLLMTRTFGVSPEADAYAAASQLPELLFAMLAGGALTAALIPVYADFRQRRDDSNATRLAHTVVTMTMVSFGALSLFVALIAPWIASELLVPHFSPEQQLRTAELMRISLIATAIFAVANVFTGLLHAHQHFLTPALATVLIDIGQIGGLIWLVDRWSIYGVAWGSVIGAILALLILTPALWRHRIGFRPSLDVATPGMHAVAYLMGLRVIALGAVQAVDLILIRLASGLPSGTISSYFYALLIMVFMPRSLFSAAIATVFFPTMSEQYNAGHEDALRLTATRGLQVILALVIPAAVGLVALGRPGVRFLFPGGRLEDSAVQVVYGLMVILALRLVSDAAQDQLSATFYAQHNTRVPMWTTLGWTIMNVALSVLLIGPLGIAGLAWASSAAAIALAIVLTILASRIGVGLDGRQLVGTIWKALVASAGMAVAIGELHRLQMPTSIFLPAALLSGTIIYVATYGFLNTVFPRMARNEPKSE